MKGLLQLIAVRLKAMDYSGVATIAWIDCAANSGIAISLMNSDLAGRLLVVVAS